MWTTTTTTRAGGYGRNNSRTQRPGQRKTNPRGDLLESGDEGYVESTPEAASRHDKAESDSNSVDVLNLAELDKGEKRTHRRV